MVYYLKNRRIMLSLLGFVWPIECLSAWWWLSWREWRTLIQFEEKSLPSWNLQRVRPNKLRQLLVEQRWHCFEIGDRFWNSSIVLVVLVVLSDFSNKSLEWELSNEELSRLLITSDFSQCNGSWLESDKFSKKYSQRRATCGASLPKTMRIKIECSLLLHWRQTFWPL